MAARSRHFRFADHRSEKAVMSMIKRCMVIAVATTVALILATARGRTTTYIFGCGATPMPSATATPVGCTTIPGTSTQVGAACLPQSSRPALNSPQDPATYGADKTGVSDNDTALINALAAGDLYISEPGDLFGQWSWAGWNQPAGRSAGSMCTRRDA